MNIKKTKVGNKIKLNISCPVCGKPLTHTTVDGMFCDKECGRSEGVIGMRNMMKELSKITGFDLTKI